MTPEHSFLVAAALSVQQLAYAKYSGFQVGAAIRAVTGEVFLGCNVENRSYGLTICAERAAVFSAVAAGQQKFAEIAVVTPGGFGPCGACLQVLSEFGPDLPVLIVDSEDPNSVQPTSVGKLLPVQFKWDGPSGS